LDEGELNKIKLGFLHDQWFWQRIW
jgi:hypothetical protein